jgi:hypothetical protein
MTLRHSGPAISLGAMEMFAYASAAGAPRTTALAFRRPPGANWIMLIVQAKLLGSATWFRSNTPDLAKAVSSVWPGLSAKNWTDCGSLPWGQATWARNSTSWLTPQMNLPPPPYLVSTMRPIPAPPPAGSGRR